MIHSYHSIHQIFYPNKKFGSEEIRNLQKYCLVNTLLQKISQIIPETPVLEKSVEPIKSNPTYWIPPKTDTLFWCIFISVNGLTEYQQIGHSYGNRILEEKLKIAKCIRDSPKSLKASNHKFTNDSIQETISEFMVDKTISFKCVAALAIYYKRPIYVINMERNIYLRYNSNKDITESDEEEAIYIYYHDYMRGEYKYKICTDEYVPSLERFVCLENDKKPFKPIGHYKVEDLYDICNKLGFDPLTEPTLKLKKAELYQLLTDKCSWYLIK
jgi:hypothetical protein